MNLQEKIKRVKELEKQNALSDQEYDELEQLKDEINLMFNGEPLPNNEPIDPALMTTIVTKTQVSYEELKQLELQIKKKRLEQQLKDLEPPKQEQEIKKTYRGIISGRIEKYLDEKRERNKPTAEKIKQLELEARQAELQARIAVAKAKKKQHSWKFSFPQIPDKIFTETGKANYEKSKKKLGDNEKNYDVFW